MCGRYYLEAGDAGEELLAMVRKAIGEGEQP